MPCVFLFLFFLPPSSIDETKYFFEKQVLVSLIIARFLTDFLWSKNRDPDIYALPIHSAFMDLVGQLLLVLCFEIVSRLGTKVRLRS